MDNMSNTNGVGFSANGQRGRSNNFEIDGQSNNDNSVTGPQVFFSNQDAIQELQIITNNFSAQYGRNMGAVVNYVTKNGTNVFHGTGIRVLHRVMALFAHPGPEGAAVRFLREWRKSVRWLHAPTVPRFVQNNYGGTLGGPILKDKLFFFGSTYWDTPFRAAFTLPRRERLSRCDWTVGIAVGLSRQPRRERTGSEWAICL